MRVCHHSFIEQSATTSEEVLRRHRKARIYRCIGYNAHGEYRGRGGTPEGHHLDGEGTRPSRKVAVRTRGRHDLLVNEADCRIARRLRQVLERRMGQKVARPGCPLRRPLLLDLYAFLYIILTGISVLFFNSKYALFPFFLYFLRFFQMIFSIPGLAQRVN